MAIGNGLSNSTACSTIVNRSDRTFMRTTDRSIDNRPDPFFHKCRLRLSYDRMVQSGEALQHQTIDLRVLRCCMQRFNELCQCAAQSTVVWHRKARLKWDATLAQQVPSYLSCSPSCLANPIVAHPPDYILCEMSYRCFCQPVLRNHVDFLIALGDRGPLPELTKLRGFHHDNLMEDTVHDDLLGIRQDLVGSALFELAQEGVAFGTAPILGGWKIRMGVQLYRATNEFSVWCRDNGKQCSQSEFRVLHLGMDTLSDWPCLKGKAHNTATVSEWVSMIASRYVFDERSEIRAVCLKAAVDIWHFTQETKYPNWALSESQKRDLETFRLKCLLSYDRLSEDSFSKNIFRYRMRPKFHHWDHGLRRCIRVGMSPSIVYTFSPEDFMGVCARMCSKVHGSTILKRGVEMVAGLFRRTAVACEVCARFV